MKLEIFVLRHSFRKYLCNRDFLEKYDAEDLQDYAAARQIFTNLQNQFPNHEQAVLLQRSVIQTYVEQGDAVNGDQVRQAVEQMKTNYQSHPDYANQMAITADRLRCTRYSNTTTPFRFSKCNNVSLINRFPSHAIACVFFVYGSVENGLSVVALP